MSLAVLGAIHTVDALFGRLDHLLLFALLLQRLLQHIRQILESTLVLVQLWKSAFVKLLNGNHKGSMSRTIGG